MYQWKKKEKSKSKRGLERPQFFKGCPCQWSIDKKGVKNHPIISWFTSSMMAMVGFLAKGQKSFTVRWSMMHLKENLKSCELKSSSGLLTEIAAVCWKLVCNCNCNCIAGATGWITRKVQLCHGMVVLSFRKGEKCCFTDPDPKSTCTEIKWAMVVKV